MNSFVVGLIISFNSTFKRLVISWSLNNLGRIVAFYNWDELSPFQNGTNWRLGRIVAFWNMGRIVAPILWMWYFTIMMVMGGGWWYGLFTCFTFVVLHRSSTLGTKRSSFPCTRAWQTRCADTPRPTLSSASRPCGLRTRALWRPWTSPRSGLWLSSPRASQRTTPANSSNSPTRRASRSWGRPPWAESSLGASRLVPPISQSNWCLRFKKD